MKLDSILNRQEKREFVAKKVRELYSLGYSYEKISKLLDISKSTIFYALAPGKNVKSPIEDLIDKNAAAAPKDDILPDIATQPK